MFTYALSRRKSFPHCPSSAACPSSSCGLLERAVATVHFTGSNGDGSRKRARERDRGKERQRDTDKREREESTAAANEDGCKSVADGKREARREECKEERPTTKKKEKKQQA